MDGHTLTDEWKDSQMAGQTRSGTDGWADRKTDRLADTQNGITKFDKTLCTEQTDWQTNGQSDKWKNGWED